MNLLKRLAKREIRKRGEKVLARIEAAKFRDGVKLNFFNSGIMVDLSTIANTARNYGVKAARKALTNLK
jgi:hypothetical protein